MYLLAYTGQRPTSTQDLDSSNPRSMTRLKTSVKLLFILPINWTVPPKRKGTKFTHATYLASKNHLEKIIEDQ